ncbi:MAG: hypothetical protein LBS09_07185 [Bacteroidales bacterium]|jgi:hypothetical protein|nr:hypothetical protein [Bacteroidales bacterium]
MKVIVEGDEKTINVIIRENRVRASRGLLTFTVMEDSEGIEPEDDNTDLEDSKVIDTGDSKVIKKVEIKKKFW